jgi:hypothetical protein
MKRFLDFLSEAKIVVEEPQVDEELYYEESDDLREQYIAGELFKEGCLIEQVSTGRTGTVMRRGTNYLICLTDDGELFKPWITDSKELE